jgi:hypothetical protein
MELGIVMNERQILSLFWGKVGLLGGCYIFSGRFAIGANSSINDIGGGEGGHPSRFKLSFLIT